MTDVPRLDPHWRGRTADQAMLLAPKSLPADATVGDVRAAFERPKTQMVVLADRPDGQSGPLLRGLVLRDDLDADVADDAPALTVSQLEGRTATADEPIEAVHERMLVEGRRRLAVVALDGRLLGLLCLQRSLTGFCTDAGVESMRSQRD